jgi:photosystem II stability/assembly factor-like uncharacterized protein
MRLASWYIRFLGACVLLPLVFLSACGSTVSLVTKTTPTTLPTVPVGSTPTPANLIRHIEMISANGGWATTANHIVHTSDGGNTWGDVTPPNFSMSKGSRLVSHFISLDEAWIISTLGAGSKPTNLYHTTDSGRTWKSTSVDTGNIIDIHFSDQNNGWLIANPDGGAAGSFPIEVWRTSNGGNSWTKSAGAPPAGGEKTGIFAKDAATAWISGGQPASDRLMWLYGTHDSGATWTAVRLPEPDSGSFSAISYAPNFFNVSDGILGASAQLSNGDKGLFVTYITHDSGATWTLGAKLTVPLGQDGIIWDYSTSGAVYAATALANGSNVAASVHNIQPFSGPGSPDYSDKPYQLLIANSSYSDWQPVAIAENSKKLFAGITQIDFISTTVGWALSSSGLIQTQDGGKSWKLLPGFSI